MTGCQNIEFFLCCFFLNKWLCFAISTSMIISPKISKTRAFFRDKLLKYRAFIQLIFLTALFFVTDCICMRLLRRKSAKFTLSSRLTILSVQFFFKLDVQMHSYFAENRQKSYVFRNWSPKNAFLFIRLKITNSNLIKFRRNNITH